MRVSFVSFFKDPDTDEETLSLVWSQGVGGPASITDIKIIENRVPIMGSGDQLIFVETFHDWTPVFNVGLDPMRFAHVSIMRPRFAPNLVWDDGTPGDDDIVLKIDGNGVVEGDLG